MFEVNDSPNRKVYLDIAKGLLIICVVLGHTYEFKYSYILYWFHMPAFFIISGMLHKPLDMQNIKKILKKNIIPYAIFAIISIVMYFITFPYKLSFIKVIKLVIRYIYGGKLIEGVFWFVPCLLLTRTIFNYMIEHLDRKTLILILVNLYFLAHFISIFIMPSNIEGFPLLLSLPLNIDVLLITIPYYSIGYFIKIYEKYLNDSIVLTSLAVCCTMCILISLVFNVNYYLDIKFSQYRFLFFDLLVPIMFTLFILSLSKNIGMYNTYLAYIGKRTLFIMYLHYPIITYLHFACGCNCLLTILMGVVFPLLISALFEEGFKRNKVVSVHNYIH
jgi:fucose 4-O-acetylase-like acetyltransferase